MKNGMLIAACVIALCAPVAAQTGTSPKKPDQVRADVEKTQAIKQKADEGPASSRPARVLTNVQVELTLTDQTGAGPAE